MVEEGNSRVEPQIDPKPTGTKRAPEGESKKERFQRLAEIRRLAVLRDLRLIANLADRRHYDYEKKDVVKLFADARRGLREAEAAFRKSFRDQGGL